MDKTFNQLTEKEQEQTIRFNFTYFFETIIGKDFFDLDILGLHTPIDKKGELILNTSECWLNLESFFLRYSILESNPAKKNALKKRSEYCAEFSQNWHIKPFCTLTETSSKDSFVYNRENSFIPYDENHPIFTKAQYEKRILTFEKFCEQTENKTLSEHFQLLKAFGDDKSIHQLIEKERSTIFNEIEQQEKEFFTEFFREKVEEFRKNVMKQYSDPNVIEEIRASLMKNKNLMFASDTLIPFDEWEEENEIGYRYHKKI